MIPDIAIAFSDRYEAEESLIKHEGLSKLIARLRSTIIRKAEKE